MRRELKKWKERQFILSSQRPIWTLERMRIEVAACYAFWLGGCGQETNT